MFSTEQRGEFKVSYKLFEREDGNVMVCTVICWKLEGCKAFGMSRSLSIQKDERVDPTCKEN